MLRVRDARLVADSGDAFVLEVAVVPFDTPADVWSPVHDGPIEVAPMHSVLWRVTAQVGADSELVMRTNDPAAPEITIPIRAVSP